MKSAVDMLFLEMYNFSLCLFSTSFLCFQTYDYHVIKLLNDVIP
jgi:hypothetical protein